MMYIFAISRLDSFPDFDGKVEIWQFCVMKQAQRAKVRCTKDEEKRFDARHSHHVVSVVVHQGVVASDQGENDLAGIGGETIQQGGAIPHTGEGTKKLKRARREEKREIKQVTQPAQSPDLNTNGLGLFASLKSRV